MFLGSTYNFLLPLTKNEMDYVETISEAVVFAGNFNTEDVVPNVFSPNGDGENDLLRFIRVNDTEEFKITIYNRWGAVIYESTNANVSWDGNSPGGKLATAGVYFFKNQQQKVIYVGKANNIKQRVTSHFYDKKNKEYQLGQDTYHIDFEETGNELVAF